MASDSRSRGVKTTDTSLTIVETLRDLDGARITELAEQLETAESTVHAHLTTLHDHGYVVKEGDVYHVGLRFLEVGQYARRRKRSNVLFETIVQDLAEETGEVAQYSVEEHGYGVFVHRAAGERGVRTPSNIGDRYPLHQLAAGKAILAKLPRHRIDEIIDQRGLPGATSKTITDRSNLEDELETIRDQGYAVNDEEVIEGYKGLGVPVRAPANRVIGALAMGGPKHRVTDDRLHGEFAELMLDIVNEAEVTLESSSREALI